jgi:hypothetical protein
MHALDVENESSCWNSDGQADGAIIHSFILNFHRRVKLSSISLQFQGGFVPEECRLLTSQSGHDEENHVKNTWNEIDDADIELENTNKLQVFDLGDVACQNDLECDVLKLEFLGSTDFYGRVILYKLIAEGENQSD